MSTLRRHVIAVIAAALLILGAAGALAVTAQPARAAVSLCNILQAGETRWVGGKLYKCTYVRGIGYIWLQVQFYGCAATRAPARLC